MKRIGFWVLLLTCLLVLPACGEHQLPPEPEEGVLTYAALSPVTTQLKRKIKNFNESHPDAQIEIRDYSDEGGRERLQTELVLGQVPDIMEMCSYGENTEGCSKLLTNFFRAALQALKTDTLCPTGRWRRKDTWRTCGLTLKTIRNWGGKEFWKRP